MFRAWAVVLLLSGALVVTAQTSKNQTQSSKRQAQTSKKHRDYVPDEKTAIQIGNAVLIAQFGEDSVKSHGPLLVDGSNKHFWIVQVPGDSLYLSGGGPAVWIDKHSGCLDVMESMK